MGRGRGRRRGLFVWSYLGFRKMGRTAFASTAVDEWSHRGGESEGEISWPGEGCELEELFSGYFWTFVLAQFFVVPQLFIREVCNQWVSRSSNPQY